MYLHYTAAEQAACEGAKLCDKTQHTEPELVLGKDVALSERMKVTES